MAINLSCKHCGAAQLLEHRYAGMTVSCAACGETVSVPHLVAADSVNGGGSRSSWAKVIGVALVGLFAGGGILAVLLMAGRSKMQYTETRLQSMNNQKQILLAMHNYHAAHGEFPPAVLAGPDGKAMHSWRVLILPYLEEEGLFSQYDFSKAWDSPENAMVAQNMPAIFRSPHEDGQTATNFTSYMLFTGQGTLFDGKGKATLGPTDK